MRLFTKPHKFLVIVRLLKTLLSVITIDSLIKECQDSIPVTRPYGKIQTRLSSGISCLQVSTCNDKANHKPPVPLAAVIISWLTLLLSFQTVNILMAS